MRTSGMMGLLAVTLVAGNAIAQGTTGLPRPASGGLRPSPGTATTGSTSASSGTVPKPAATSSFPRPSASAFARPMPTAAEEAAPVEEAAAPPSSSFQPSSRFGGSQFTPATENTTGTAGGSFRGLSDTAETAPQPEADVQPAQATTQFNPQSRLSNPPESRLSNTPAPTASRMTPSVGSSSLPARTFGGGATTYDSGNTSNTTSATAPATLPTTSSSTTAPRNALPTRTLGSRVASATPAPTAVSTPAESASPIAEQLLKTSLEARAQHALPGQPVPLSAVVERGAGSAQRIRAVQTYWKLVTKMTVYHAAVDDRNLFAQINSRQLAAHDRAALAAAQLAADAAISRAELDFVNTQNELAEVARFSDVELQALPTDVPLVSEYRTHFTTLYGSGSAPSGLRRLDRAMPYHLKNVRSRADSVVSAQQALQAAVEAVTTGQASVSSLLEVHQHYHRERVAFATAVFDYNAMIAEYALNVAPNQPPSTIVGMLIKTRPITRSATVVREDAVVRTISSEEPIAADNAPELRSAQPRTIEYAQPTRAIPNQAIQYEAEDVVTEGQIIDSQPIEDPAVIMAEEVSPFRR